MAKWWHFVINYISVIYVLWTVTDVVFSIRVWDFAMLWDKIIMYDT